VPLIGPSTGAMVLHQPVQKHVFNVRATYQREAEKAITHLATIGITRIAVVYSDDTFGEDVLIGVQKGMTAAKLTPVVLEKFDRAKPDFSKIGAMVQKSGAQNVLVVAAGSAVVDCLKAIRAAGSQAQLVTLSNNASGGFITSLGSYATGVIVTQVFPQSLGYTFVKEAQDLARAKNINEVSPAALEGFAAAKVLVEALRRTNGKPTREKINAALEGMSKFDLGGLEISYSSKDHTGLDFADLSIISAAGKFRR
jgi:branched-chain amino acid transport system substrate-binding protein